MYKQCKSLQSSQRQENIAECLLQMIQEKPYEEITITELCKKAAVPRNTFYRYFANKDAVLSYSTERFFNEHLELLLHIYEKRLGWQLADYLALWLEKYRKNEPFWEIVNMSSQRNMLLDQMVKNQTKLADPVCNIDFSNLATKRMVFVAYGVQGILDAWRYSGYSQPEHEIAVQVCKLLEVPLLDCIPPGERVKSVVFDTMKYSYFAE